MRRKELVIYSVAALLMAEAARLVFTTPGREICMELIRCFAHRSDPGIKAPPDYFAKLRGERDTNVPWMPKSVERGSSALDRPYEMKLGGGGGFPAGKK